MTLPVMLKLNGLSFESFVVKLTSPLFVPAVVVSRRTMNVVVAPAATLVAACVVTVYPAGAVTVPSAKAVSPSFRTVKVRLITVPPCSVEPKFVWSDALGVESPSAMLTPLPSTTISGGVATMPRIWKLNGFSSESLVVKLISPDFVPAVEVSSRTVNVVVPIPAATFVAGCVVTVKPVGAVTDPSVKAAPPSFRTVNVRLSAVPPCTTVPKSVLSNVVGVVSPSAILIELPSTMISGLGGTTAPLIWKLN